MWVYKDGMFFGKEFGNMGLLLFFFCVCLFFIPAILHSLEFGGFSNTKREIGGRMIIRVSSKV